MAVDGGGELLDAKADRQVALVVGATARIGAVAGLQVRGDRDVDRTLAVARRKTNTMHTCECGSEAPNNSIPRRWELGHHRR